MANTNRQSRFLTTAEVAQLLGRHPVTIQRWVAAGRLIPVRNHKAGFLFRESDINRLVKRVA